MYLKVDIEIERYKQIDSHIKFRLNEKRDKYGNSEKLQKKIFKIIYYKITIKYIVKVLQLINYYIFIDSLIIKLP